MNIENKLKILTWMLESCDGSAILEAGDLSENITHREVWEFACEVRDTMADKLEAEFDNEEFVEAEIIRDAGVGVICWIAIGPQGRVKGSISKDILESGDVKLIPGVHFLWSRGLQQVKPIPADPTLLAELARLEAELDS